MSSIEEARQAKREAKPFEVHPRHNMIRGCRCKRRARSLLRFKKKEVSEG